MSIGIGILGLAHGHVSMYCTQWKQMPADQVKLIAAWDHDAERLAGAVKSFEVSAEATAESLLARKDVDAIVIGSETSLHADLVEKAAKAGKAIILQKPLALTMEEGQRIVDAVGKYNVPFTLAWQMRVDPQNIQMKKLIEDGTLGRVFMVRRRHGLSTHTWPGFENSWHVKPELNRGMWADDAAHAIDFLYWLLGKPISVTAEVDTLRTPKVPDDNGIAIFRYADGTFAEVMSSFVCIAGENTTEIVGEKGVAIQNFGDLVSCNVPRAENAVGLKWFLQETRQWTSSEIASPPTHASRINGLALPLLDFLQNKRGPIATAHEGLDVLRITLASYESARQGRRISLTDSL